jgi:capsular polysaccharide transport system permease protein
MTFRVSATTLKEPGAGLAAASAGLSGLLRRIPPLFVWIVVIPGVAASIYWLLLASPVYVSEAQFIVRAPSQSLPQPSGLTAVLQGVGLAPAATDSFIVHDYAMSHDAVATLDAQHRLRDALGRPGVDFLSRFPRPFEQPSTESLAKAYPRFVSVDYNSSTGISTLQVRAFAPQDAQDIATKLLEGGEVVINRLNDRADQDAVEETKREITEAETSLVQAEASLTAFRNREQLIDPTRSSTVNLELMGKLQGDIATLQAERAGIASAAPQSPQLPALDSRIHAYEAEAQAEQAKMAGQAGSLAPMIGEYERLTLDRDFAGKTVQTATAAADEARLDARRKRLYLERISNPNLPDAPTEPHRLQNLATFWMTLLLIYATVALVLAGFREHRQT